MRARGVARPSHERLFLMLTVLARGLTLLALGLAIVASSKLGARPTDAEIDASYAFQKATAVILVFAYVAYAALAATLVKSRAEMGSSDSRLFLGAVATLPFFLVMAVYQLLVAFDRRSTSLQPWNLHPYPEAFMSTTMEFIVVLLLVLSGLRCPVWRPSLVDRGYETPAPNFPGNGTITFRAVEPLNDTVELEPISPRTQEPVAEQPVTEPPEGEESTVV
jgi:hypothetical protein